MRRSFAFAQDDASRKCGVGKAERAERSGLPRFFFGYFLLIMQKKVTIKKEFTAIPPPSPSRKDSGQALQRGIGCQFDEGVSYYFKI